MSRWDQFADEAELFVQWAYGGMQPGRDGVFEALERIALLYAAGVQVPEAEAGDGEADDFRVNQAEWQQVFEHSAILGLDYYHTCDPDLDTKAEHMVGSLSDDIADIYHDVLTGLRMYRAGRTKDAAWEWSLSFRAHWGSHASDAIRVLHRHLFC